MHKEYRRIVHNAGKAILLIHGIAGTPNHFKRLMPLIPESISVVNILLDGHGKGVKDFAQSSMKKWEEQVALAVDKLSQQHDEIYIVAHSLGCLLAIEQAVANAKVKKLFLLAAPLKLFLKPRMFVNSLKVYFNIDTGNERIIAAKECYGIRDSKNPLLYIGWLPRFFELFSKIKKTRKIIPYLHTPCVACQSCHDEMVAKKSGRILESNPVISVIELKNSSHYYYEKNDFLLLKEQFTEFLL